MTKLSTSYKFGSGSEITFSNANKFIPGDVNGFLPSTTVIDWTTNSQFKSFKLDEVYFFNIVFYNPYNSDQTIENLVNGELEGFVKVQTDNVFPSVLDKTYMLTKDGYYIIGQLIALDKTYYDSHKDTNRFKGTDYIVYDNTVKLFYHAKDGVYTKLTVFDLFDEQLTSIAYMKSVQKVFVTTMLYSCYMNVMDSYIKSLLSVCQKCDWHNDFLILYMTIEAIKYRTQSCEFNTAQKYLEWINQSTGLCGTSSINVKCNCTK